MKKILFLLVAVSIATTLSAQKDVTLKINHMLNGGAFAFNQTTTNDLSNNLKYSRVEYYISNIKIIHDGGTSTAVVDKHILVDCNGNLSESLGSFNVNSVEGITFSIGVDPLENHNDPALKSSGDPLAYQTPSMHWGWTSGYRFVALEGLGGASTNNTFEFHGLYDQNYFSQTVMVAGVDNGNQIDINLDADYALALSDVNVNNGGIYHGDNTQDLKVLRNFRDKVFKAGGTTAIRNTDRSDYVSVYPVPSTGLVNVKISDELLSQKITSMELVDLLGRSVNHLNLDGSSEFTFTQDQSGIYFLSLMAGEEVLARETVVIQ